MKELLDAIPTDIQPRDDLDWDALSAHAETDADFRMLEAMLRKLDPDSRWGGLSRRVTPEGLTLFLCRDHYRAYR